MNKKFNLIVLLIVLLAAVPGYSWYSQLFPYNAGSFDEATVNFSSRSWRLLDYSYAGYNLGETPLQTGIPCNVRTVAGTGDITIELQNLINTVGAAGGGIVKIPAGTFTITQTAAGRPIGINYDNVSIEGAGSGYTRIDVPATHAYSDDSNAFEGTFTFEKLNFAWNKGWVEGGTDLSHVSAVIAEGATYITGLTNLAAVPVGAWIVVQQYFWAAFTAANSNSTWTAGDPGNREYSFTYLRKVLSKDASGITLDAPIPYTLNPSNNTIYIKTSGTTNGMLQNVGISGMTIQFADNNNGTGGRAGFPSGCAIYFEGVVNGWVKDVTVINFPRYGILPEYSARITIEDSYVKKTQDYGGGGSGYGFYVNCSQNILIKRCRGEQTRHNFILSRALSHNVVMTQCESFDSMECEDTHFGFSHAILRDKFVMGNGNAYSGYNRWTTSGNAYESFGSGAVWNLYGDGYGGQWHGAELNINPSVSGNAVLVGVAGNYMVNDGAGYAPSGTYVAGTVIPNNSGLQVGPASWRQNVLYEGVGYQTGLLPESLYEEQLKNRVGTVADWANVCGDAPTLTPVPTNTPVLTPGILVFDSEIPAFGLGLGGAAVTPATTITPGSNPNDAGQNRTINGAESFRLTSASADWGVVANFGGPVMNTASMLRFDGWVYITDANFNFRIQLQNPAGTDIGTSVVVTAAMADGGVFNVNQWNHFQIPIASFGYSGTFTGIGMRTGTLTAGKTAWFDDLYFIPNVLPSPTNTSASPATFTRTRTMTPTHTRTNTLSAPTFTFTATGTGTFTRTHTPTHTRTNTVSVPTATFTTTGTGTFTRSQTPTHTRTNTISLPTATFTRTATGTPVTAACKRMLAYYPYWVAGYKQDKIPYNRLTHICHAFIQPQADGSLVAPGGFIEPLLLTNAHLNGVKVLVSIGGADETARLNFVTIAASLALRTAFANNVEAFCRANNYDGADIDWEFPQDAVQRTNQNLLLQAVRDRFDAAAAPAPSWEISMAVSPGNWYGQWNDYAALNGIVSFYNLMNYDYHGGWSPHSGHNAALYRGADPTIGEDIDWTNTYMTVTRGVPASMLNLGLAFYGYRFPASENIYDNCGGSCAAATQLNYTAVTPLIGAGWTYNYDAGSQVPYLRYDSGAGFITYDDPASITNKVNYALSSRGYGGIFMWEITGDYSAGSQPLFDAMYNGYASFCGLSTPTNTPVTTPTFTRTRTMTMTSTRTNTPASSATNTQVMTATFTRTHTPANTFTGSATVTQVITQTFTVTSTHTYTRSITPSFTSTMTLTPTASPTRTPTMTRTATATRTNSPDYSPTQTWTGTPPTATNSPTITLTETYTFTETLLPTDTITLTNTPTASVTNTLVSSQTITRTHTPSVTLTVSSSRTPVSSSTATATPSVSRTRTPAATPTGSITSSMTFTATATYTMTVTRTSTAPATATPVPTAAASPTITATEVQEGAVFEMSNVVIYPNPVMQGSVLNVRLNLSQLPALIELRIYTASFRLVRKISWDSGINRGQNTLSVPQWKISQLAAGVYYCVITAKKQPGAEIKSNPGHLIILRK